MTTEQARKLLIKIQTLESDIETIDKTILEIGVSGYASATLSSGSGSKSYTRQSIDSLTNLREYLSKQIAKYRKLLNGGCGINTIYTVYS